MSLDALVGLAVNLVFGVVGALAVIGPYAARQRRKGRVLANFTDERLSTFLDDWFGEPERPGFPPRPGVPERLRRVEREVVPNHGSSLRDAVDKVAQRLEAVERLVVPARGPA